MNTDYKKLLVFFKTQKIEPKTSTMVKKGRILRFCNQIYKKKKQYRNRRFNQKTRLQKFKQVDKTHVNQTRQLHANNRSNRRKRKHHQKRP